MSPLPSRAAIIAALVGKDLRSFATDRLWVALAPFSIAFVVVAFWLAPAEVNDTLHVGVHPPSAVELMAQIAASDTDEDGIVLVPFEEAGRLASAVRGDLEDASEGEGEVALGLAFPADFRAAIGAGRSTRVVMHITDQVPEPLRRAFAGEVRELGFAMQALLAGRDVTEVLPVTFPDGDSVVLGEDRAGAQVPMRDKLRPMLAILILLLGSIAIAGLVAVEIEHRTITSLLVTPASTGDILAAKSITGVVLGASQALIFLLVTASLGPHWPVVVGLMLLAALMMAALGMIAGTAGRDFMSTMFGAIALLIPVTAPTFAALFPGSTSLVIKLMPSWGFTEGLVGLLGYGRAPGELVVPILSCVGWTAALLILSLVLLRRRVEAL